MLVFDAHASHPIPFLRFFVLRERHCLHGDSEWRDHIQAGVCPPSRRGHTATLVIGRQKPEPKNAIDALPSSKLSDDKSNRGFDTTHGSMTTGGGNRATSSLRRKRSLTRDGSTNGAYCRSKTSEQQHRWEGPPSSRRGIFRGDEATSHHRDVRRRSCRRNEAGGFVSKEMFVIGGAGTDAIRVRIRRTT